MFRCFFELGSFIVANIGEFTFGKSSEPRVFENSQIKCLVIEFNVSHKVLSLLKRHLMYGIEVSVITCWFCDALTWHSLNKKVWREPVKCFPLL